MTVFLLACAVVTVPRMVNWENVRAIVEETGSEALGRKVKVANLRVRGFSGIEFEGLEIGPRSGSTQEPLIKAARVVARYRLLPLLRLKLVVHKLEFIEPELHVERNRHGRWSFSDLLSSRKERKAGPGSIRGTVLPVQVEIREVRIVSAMMALRDRAGKGERLVGVSELDLTLKNLSLTGAPVWLKCGGVIEMSGKSLPVSVEGSLGVGSNRSVVTLHDFAVKIPGVRLVTNGEITDFRTTPRLDIEKRARFDLEELWGAATAIAGPGYRETGFPEGAVEVLVKITGTTRSMAVDGKIELSDVGFRRQGMPAVLESLEGDFFFDQNRLHTSNLRLIALGNPFALEFDARNLGLENPASFSPRNFSPRIRVVLTSPRVAVDRMLKFLERRVPGAGVASAVPSAALPKKDPPKEPNFKWKIPRGVVVDGDVRFEEVSFRKTRIEKERFRFAMKRGKVSYRQECELYGGRQSGSGDINLISYPIVHSHYARAAGIEAGPLVNAAAESFLSGKEAGLLKGKLSGTAGAEIRLNGKGIMAPSLKKGLKGEGNLEVRDGSMTRPRLIAAVADKLGQSWMDKDFPFHRLGGKFSFADLKLETSGFVMDPGASGDFGLHYRGMLDLDDLELERMRVRGVLATRFHPRHAGRAASGNVGSVLFETDAAGWVSGEWEVRGSVKEPLVTPRMKKLKKRAADAAKRN